MIGDRDRPKLVLRDLRKIARGLTLATIAILALASCELFQQNPKSLPKPLSPTVTVPHATGAVAAQPLPPKQNPTIDLSGPPGSDESKFAGGQKPPPIVVQGSGALVAAIPGSSQVLPPATPDQDVAVTLNFVDADIRELIRSVLGDTLALSYVIDPKVTGTITLKTNTPLKRDELLPALENVLNLNGYALVKNGATFTVQPSTDVKDVPLLPARQESGFGLEIMRLHHVAASEVKTVLDQYASHGAVRVVDDTRGLIAVAASGPERLKIRELIDVFDVDQLKGMSFGLYPVSAAEPREIISELEVIFNPAKQANQNGVLKFLPINRLSSILVIASRPGDLTSAGGWIDRLDHRLVSDKPRLYVHYVQHGQAKEIAATLQAIFGGEQATVETPPPAGGSVAPNQSPGEITSSAIVPGYTPGYAPGSPTTPGNFVNAAATGSMAHDVSQPPDATDAAAAEPQAAVAAPEPSVNSSTTPGRNIRIIADVPNNALFILATPQDFRDIDAALEQIDTEPLQVLIEATIAEVTLNDKLQYGVEWFFQHQQNSVDLSQVASGIPTAVFPGFSYIYAAANASVVLSALDSITNVNVISSPQLMVLDNRSAMLQVGDQVPIITQSAVSVADPAAPIVNSVQYHDTGVILNVTPRVNSNGGVELDIEQEVSDVVPTTSSTIDSPTIQQRKIRSSVSIHDGESVALGGLIRDRQSRGKAGVPGLSDIPIVGTLFGTKTNTSDRTELLVLITPHVVRNPEQADAITDELRQRLQSVIPLTTKIQ